MIAIGIGLKWLNHGYCVGKRKSGIFIRFSFLINLIRQRGVIRAREHGLTMSNKNK
jgi:hypothetical protein